MKRQGRADRIKAFWRGKRRAAAALFAVCAAMLTLLAVSASPASAATAKPAASLATHYTSKACASDPSDRRNGMCLFNNGTNNAWDAVKADNKTLDDWAYPGTKLSIGANITGATIYSSPDCKVRFWTQEYNNGSHYDWSGSVTGHHITFDNFKNHVYSFEWICT